MSAQLDEEFRDFMHSRWPAMVRLAYALTGDQGHAEDVAQAAFARAYAYWPKVRRTGNPESYVRRIVINENRNRFRRQRVVVADLDGQLVAARVHQAVVVEAARTGGSVGHRRGHADESSRRHCEREGAVLTRHACLPPKEFYGFSTR